MGQVLVRADCADSQKCRKKKLCPRPAGQWRRPCQLHLSLRKFQTVLGDHWCLDCHSLFVATKRMIFSERIRGSSPGCLRKEPPFAFGLLLLAALLPRALELNARLAKSLAQKGPVFFSQSASAVSPCPKSSQFHL